MTNQEDRFPIIETKRLILRDPQEKDAGFLLEAAQNEVALRYFGLKRYQTELDARVEINRLQRNFANRQAIRWVITKKSEDRYMGDIGFHNYALENSRVEVGFKLHAAYWRQGIMTEAMLAILDHGFEVMNLNRIEALVDPRNIPSFKLLGKLQFSFEGLLREYEFERDQFVDLAMYSLLKREFPIVRRHFD